MNDEVVKALSEFTIRIAKKENATPEELVAMTEVADMLLKDRTIINIGD